MTTITFDTISAGATTGLTSTVGADNQMMDRDRGDGWGWAGWASMWLMMALFWIAVAAVVIWVVRSSRPHGEAGPTPLDVARNRYARGEIGDEEIERIKRGLS